MHPVPRTICASLLALSLAALSTAARADAPSLLPCLAPAGQPFCTSLPAGATALLPSLASPRVLPGDGPVPLQIDPGGDNLRTIVMDFPSGDPLATIYLVTTTLGSFHTGEEYWYVNRDAISGNLGTNGLTITVTDSNTTTPPSDPGYSPEQKFEQAVTPSGGWGTGWTTDPLSTGDLYAGPGGTYLRFLTSSGSPPSVNWVVWYQVLASGSPANLDPSGSWTASSGSVSVPSGSTGYDIAQETD